MRCSNTMQAGLICRKTKGVTRVVGKGIDQFKAKICMLDGTLRNHFFQSRYKGQCPRALVCCISGVGQLSLKLHNL